MAKRRRRRAASSSAPIVRTVRAPAPVVRVSVPRAAKVRHRRGKGGGGVGALSVQRMLAIGLGGMALGFIEKAVPSMPTIPVIGKKGTIALVAYFMSRGGHGPSILRDVAVVASGMAGYELGATGKISGDFDQVHGVAAQV